jgi:hypothetical protein
VAALELSPLLFLKHISLLLRLSIVLTERIKIFLTRAWILIRVQKKLWELS